MNRQSSPLLGILITLIVLTNYSLCLSTHDQKKLYSAYQSKTAIKTSRSNFFLGKQFKSITPVLFQHSLFTRVKKFDNLLRVNKFNISFTGKFDLIGNNTEPFINATITIHTDSSDNWEKFDADTNWAEMTNFSKDSEEGRPMHSEEDDVILVRSFDGQAPESDGFVAQLFQLNKIELEFEGQRLDFTVTVSEYRTQDMGSPIFTHDTEIEKNTEIFKVMLHRLLHVSEIINDQHIVHGDIRPENLTLTRVDLPVFNKFVPPKLTNFERSVNLRKPGAVFPPSVLDDPDNKFEHFMLVPKELFEDEYRCPLHVNVIDQVLPESKEGLRQLYPVSTLGFDNDYAMVKSIFKIVQINQYDIEIEDQFFKKLEVLLKDFMKTFESMDNTDVQRREKLEQIHAHFNDIETEAVEFQVSEFPYRDELLQIKTDPSYIDQNAHKLANQHVPLNESIQEVLDSNIDEATKSPGITASQMKKIRNEVYVMAMPRDSSLHELDSSKKQDLAQEMAVLGGLDFDDTQQKEIVLEDEHQQKIVDLKTLDPGFVRFDKNDPNAVSQNDVLDFLKDKSNGTSRLVKLPVSNVRESQERRLRDRVEKSGLNYSRLLVI